MGDSNKLAKSDSPPAPVLFAGPILDTITALGPGNAIAALPPATTAHPAIELDTEHPGWFSFTGPWTIDAVKAELYGGLAALAPPFDTVNAPIGWKNELAFAPAYLREPYRSQYQQLLPAAPVPPPVVVPPELEAALVGELQMRVSGAAALARRQRLLAMFRAVASPYREVLGQRLAHPAAGDRLAALFVDQLAPQTQSALRAALRGEIVALPPDPSELSQFVATLTADMLDVDPQPAVIGPWMHQVDVVVALVAPEAMPVIAEPLELQWSLVDADGITLETSTGRWLPGLAEGDGFSRPFMTAGKFTVRLDVIAGGLYLKTLSAPVTVSLFERGTDVKTGMVDLGTTSAAQAMSDRQVLEELRATQQKLAGMSPADAQSEGHVSLVGAETALESELANRELSPAPLVPKDEARSIGLASLSEQVGGFGVPGATDVVTPDPVYARIHLEQVTAAAGWDAAKGLVDYIEQAGQGDPSGSKELGDLLRETLPIYRAQLALLEVERADLIASFTDRAKDLTREVLRQSEDRAGDAAMRYGIVREDPEPGSSRLPTYRMDNNEYTKALARAAQELADEQREVQALTAKAADLKRAAMVAQPVPSSTMGEPSEMSDFAGTPELQQYQEVAQLLAEATSDYQEQRAAHETTYPILALAKNEKGDDLDLAKLDRLASGQPDDMVQLIGRKIDLTLAHIALAQDALVSGKMNVWREPTVVDMTKLKMQLAEGSFRARWIDEHVEDEEPGFWEKYGLALVALVLSLVAALPTGGSSLVAGATAIAGILAFGVDAYLALKAIDEYELRAAMAGSDYDKARALSKSEPSLFWLAVQLVGTAFSAGAGVKAASRLTRVFGEIVQARRAVIAAGQVAKVEAVAEQVAALRNAARDAELTEQATERLVRDTADEIPRDVAEAAGVTSKAETAAGEAASAREVQTLTDRGNAAVRAADDAEVGRIAAQRRPVPVGQRRAALLAERGGEAERLAARPDGWTGAKEAEWRGYPEPPEGHEWYWKGDDIELRLKAGGRQANLTRYHYDGVGFVEVESDAVQRARFHSRETWEIPPNQRDRLSRFARSRQRSQALKTILEGDELKKVAVRMTRASESLGEEAAARWVQATYPEAIPLKGWPPSGTAGVAFEFDQIWKVPGAGPNGTDLFIVVEAKGATAELGTRTVGAAVVEQGTAPYYEATVSAMRQAGKPGARELANAAPGAVRYVKVKAPVSEAFGRQTVRDLVISDFDIP